MKKRTRIAIAVALLLAAYFALAWWLLMAPRPAAGSIPEWTPAEKKWVKERMKFHGVEVSILDKDGHYFIRNGRRCRL